MKQTVLSIFNYKESLLVNKSFLLVLFLLLGFLGFLDATYLTIVHYKNIIPSCSLAHGCETVLTSKYAVVGSIPIALLGSVFYLTIIILLGIFWQTGKKVLTSMLLALTTFGLLVAFYLVYLQAFVLHAFCQYCLGSEVIDFLLFDCAWWLWRRTNKD